MTEEIYTRSEDLAGKFYCSVEFERENWSKTYFQSDFAGKVSMMPHGEFRLIKENEKFRYEIYFAPANTRKTTGTILRWKNKRLPNRTVKNAIYKKLKSLFEKTEIFNQECQ
ncbi:MAG: hypothetical protein GX638_00335 [Crenarchaeota archaeon]|nr:hypothetical protein [Thermoproteota archaeon]